MATNILKPIVLWSETREAVTLTVNLQDVTDWNVNIEEESLSFNCTRENDQYAFSLNFPHPINKEESKYTVKRNIEFKLIKKESKVWDCVDTTPGKKFWLKCDWSKWKDLEDEEKPDFFGNFDLGNPNFGEGMGMGGGDFGDDDFDSGSDNEEDLQDFDPLAADSKDVEKSSPCCSTKSSGPNDCCKAQKNVKDGSFCCGKDDCSPKHNGVLNGNDKIDMNDNNSPCPKVAATSAI